MKTQRFSIIIGAAKAGTSSLCYNFKHHPGVSISQPKETNFFSDKTSTQKSQEAYLRHWAHDPSFDEKILLEASPSYSQADSSPIFKRIHDTLKDTVKFIYIVRNPYERIESHYNFGIERMHWNYKGSLLRETTLVGSDYKKHIDAVLNDYSKDQLLVVSYETLKNEPQKIVCDICRFLEIDDSFTLPEARRIAVTGNITKMDHWDWRYKTRLLGKAHPVIFNPATKKIFNLNQPLEKRSLSTKEREQVRDRFGKDWDYLAEEWNIDTSSWHQPERLSATSI